MICISSDDYDLSSDVVAEYLIYFGKDFDRIDNEFSFQDLSLIITNESLTTNCDIRNEKKAINFNNQNDTFWYRRGLISPASPYTKEEVQNKKLVDYLNKEYVLVSKFISSIVSSNNDFFNANENSRIYNIQLAKQIGFAIPNTLITTCKQEVTKFLEKNKKIITKPIHDGHLFYEQGDLVYQSPGTILVTKEIIDELSLNFRYSLFQEYIEKQYEVRVFYFRGIIFSCAIFSQFNENSKLDYRSADHIRPNRIIPYSLPKKIELLVNEFMKVSKLSSGSFDFIVTPTDDYVFLEINPTGMFGKNSELCNFYIERKIALEL